MSSFKNRYLIYSFIVFFIIILSSPLIIIKAVNTSYVKNRISAQILKKTNIAIDAAKIYFTLSPQPSLNVDNFNFNPDNKISITIETIKFNINFKNFFSGKIGVSQILILNPLIKIPEPTLTTDAENQSDVTKFGVSKPDISTSISQLIPEIKKLFDYLPSYQDTIEFKFQNLISHYFKSMDGSFYISKSENKILLHTIIKDIAFQTSKIFGTEFEEYLDLEFINVHQIECSVGFDSQKKIHGNINLTDLLLKSKNNTVLFDPQYLDTSFQISDNFYQVDVKPFKITRPFKINKQQGNVAIHFKDNHAQKKTQLQFTGTNINIEQAKKKALVLFKDNKITKDIFNILNKGNASFIDVAFHEKNFENLFNEKNYKLSGKINNGVVSIPGTDLIATDIKGTANIEKGVLHINADKGVIQGSKIKKGTLSVDLANYVDFPFHGEFELDIDLARIPQTLISLLPDSLLTKELLLVHDITGRADAKLNLSMETQTEDLEVKVSTSDFAIAGFYDRIPWKIDLKKINFMYEFDSAHLKNINGIVNNSTIDDLELFFDFKNETLINIISGFVVLDPDPMMPWLMSIKKINDLISPVKKADGKIHIESIQLSGPLLEPDKWQYALKGRGVDLDITTHLNQKEIESLSCSYHISNEYLNLDHVSLKIEKFSWLEPFIETKYLKSIVLPINLNRGKLQIKPEHSFLNSDLEFDTRAIISIDLSGKTPESLKLNSIKFQDQELSKGSISFNYVKDKPLYNFSGFLNTISFKKLIKPHSHWGEKINTITEGQPVLIYTNKNSNINIISKTINLGSYETQSDNTSIAPPQYGQIFGKSINFKTDILKIKNSTFTNIDTKIFFNSGGTVIKINKAFLCDLETGGYIKLTDNKIQMNTPIKTIGMPDIQNLLNCFFKEKEFMTGNYSLTCDLSSNSQKKDFLKNINGPLEFTAIDGRIYKFTLLSRILSVLNISSLLKGKVPDISQQGFEYNNILIQADIKESIIYLNQAIIDGNDMTLVFQGWIDPFNDKINLSCLVAPFKTVDLIIQKIPIISTLLGGRLLSIPVKASGKLSDPFIMPLEPSAIGDGLINMMTDIVKTPIKLWDKIDGGQ